MPALAYASMSVAMLDADLPMSKSIRAVRAPIDFRKLISYGGAVPAVRPIWKLPSTGAGVGAGERGRRRGRRRAAG